MSETSNHPQREKEPPSGYTPASPVKRTLAWIGLVYMLILLGLTTYFYFTGTTLGNLAPGLAVPGLAGFGVLNLVSWRTTGHPSKWLAIGTAILCWVLVGIIMPAAIAGLMSNF